VSVRKVDKTKKWVLLILLFLYSFL